MSQNLDDFIDLFNDEGHTYSLKREEPWTTTEAYIYVDRSAKVQLEPEVRYVEIGTLSSFTEERYLQTHLSSSGPIFKELYKKANLALWYAYEREQEREDEDARLHAHKPKDVRLRKPGTWGIPDEQTLCNAGKKLEHEDLTRAGDAMRKHRTQRRRTYKGDIEDVTGTGAIPGIESYSVIRGEKPSDSKPMIHYTITGEERWGSLPLPEPNDLNSPRNHPIFNQEGQRLVDEIVKNERTYWYKNHSDNGRYGEFEIIGWLDEGDPKAARDAAQKGQLYVRMAGKGARWSIDGSVLFGFLEATEILVNDATGKPLGGIRDTVKAKMPSPPTIYTSPEDVQTTHVLIPSSQLPTQIPSPSSRNTRPLPRQTDVVPTFSQTPIAAPPNQIPSQPSYNTKPLPQQTAVLPTPSSSGTIHRRGKAILLAALAVSLIIMGSIGLYAFSAQKTAINNAHATATTQANNIATAQVIQATNQANTDATQAADQATANAQATEQANAQATAAANAATAQAVDQATAQAQANAVATATAIVAYNPYLPNTGTLVINDPLSDNSQGYQWDASPTCVFTNGAYQVSTSANVLSTCTAEATNFTGNFVYQVDITIGEGCGGVTFFSQGDNFNYTLFEVCQDGSSDISICSSSNGNADCSGGGNISPTSAVQTGSGQKNTLAVVYANNSLSFYVNQQLLQTIGSGMASITGGKIGVLANIPSTGGYGQVTCSNLKVWTL